MRQSSASVRRALVTAVSGLALLGLAACGGDGDGGLVGADPATTGAAAVETTAATPEPTGATAPSATAGASPTTGDPTATTVAGPTGGPLEVRALDYSFALPPTIPKDATSIRLVNEGAEDHELLVGRMADGVTLEQVKAATSLKTLVPETMVLDVQVGQTAETAIPVVAGNWFMACYLTTKDGKSHSELGMIGTFTAP
jgi:hypothetical protein